MAVQPGLCRTWSDIPKTGFLTTRLILYTSEMNTVPKENHDYIMQIKKCNN